MMKGIVMVGPIPIGKLILLFSDPKKPYKTEKQGVLEDMLIGYCKSVWSASDSHSNKESARASGSLEGICNVVVKLPDFHICQNRVGISGHRR